MVEPSKKIDEAWKEQAEREKRLAEAAGPKAGPSGSPPAQTERPVGEAEAPEARFDLFLSGLAMETLIALGDMPHPTTRRQTINLPQAKYLIDLLGILEEKTKGNLSAEENRLFKDTLYQLRMRYLTKAGG